MIKLSRRAMASAAAVLAIGAAAATWTATSAVAAPAKAAALSAVIPRCQPAQLDVWVSPNSAIHTATETYLKLDYTNVSRTECHLYSWPGVSAINGTNGQLGAAAVRKADVPAKYINIAPGATAHSVLGYFNTKVTAACSPTTAAYLRVYPPDDNVARNAYFAVRVCTNKTDYLTVGRVQAGV